MYIHSSYTAHTLIFKNKKPYYTCQNKFPISLSALTTSELDFLKKEREIDSVVFQQKLVKTFLYIKVVILY